MDKQNQLIKDIQKVFDSKSPHMQMTKAVSLLVELLVEPTTQPILVNNVIASLKESKTVDTAALVKAWAKELNKVLKGTFLWEQKQGRVLITTHTLHAAGIPSLVNHYYYRGMVMPEPFTVNNIFAQDRIPIEERLLDDNITDETKLKLYLELAATRELTKDESNKLKGVKMREGKRLKAEAAAREEAMTKIKAEQERRRQQFREQLIEDEANEETKLFAGDVQLDLSKLDMDGDGSIPADEEDLIKYLQDLNF